MSDNQGISQFTERSGWRCQETSKVTSLWQREKQSQSVFYNSIHKNDHSNSDAAAIRCKKLTQLHCFGKGRRWIFDKAIFVAVTFSGRLHASDSDRHRFGKPMTTKRKRRRERRRLKSFRSVYTYIIIIITITYTTDTPLLDDLLDEKGTLSSRPWRQVPDLKGYKATLRPASFSSFMSLFFAASISLLKWSWMDVSAIKSLSSSKIV